MRLSKMLKLYIATEGIEQRKLAEEIGINASTLSRFLSGESLPAADAFMRILSWCTGAPIPQDDLQTRVDALEKNVETLNARTGGLVRLR